MKQSDIKVGRTYRNRGKGTTTRTVMMIADCPMMPWMVIERPAVSFSPQVKGDSHRQPYSCVSLKEFARWAGSEVIDEG